MAWKSATIVVEESGYPWEVWDNFSDSSLSKAACDNDTSTYIEALSQTGWTGEFLEANYSGGLWCSKVRVYLQNQVANQIDIDAYYDGDWQSVFSGSTSEGAYKTYWLPKIVFIEKIRIRLYSSGTSVHRVNEVDFWEVEEDAPGIDNLTALFKLNDNLATANVIDSSGNGRDGTASKNTSGFNAAGKINDSFEFTGSNERVNINKDVITGLPFSFVCWANTTESATHRYIADDSTDSNRDASNFLVFVVSDDKLGYRVGGSGSNEVYSQFDEGGWHSVTLTVDNGGNVTVYVDGTVAHTRSGISFSGLTYGLMLGNRQDLGRDFLGFLDAVMIFDKVLSANEVAWLYNRGRGKENVMIPRYAMEKY